MRSTSLHMFSIVVIFASAFTAAATPSDISRVSFAFCMFSSAAVSSHSNPSADVKLDRKSLSELAKNEPLSFQQIVAVAKSALASNYDKSSQDGVKASQ